MGDFETVSALQPLIFFGISRLLFFYGGFDLQRMVNIRQCGRRDMSGLETWWLFTWVQGEDLMQLFSSCKKANLVVKELSVG